MKPECMPTCKYGNHPPISICDKCPLFKKGCPVEKNERGQDMTNHEAYMEITILARYIVSVCNDGDDKFATPKQASTAIIKTVSEILDYVIQLKEG